MSLPGGISGSTERSSHVDSSTVTEPKALRVLHLGNTNNIGLLNVRILRAGGVHADLLVDPTDHVSYQPRWAEPEAEPPWVRYYSNRFRHGFAVGQRRIPFPYVHRVQQALDVVRLRRDYSLLQAYNYDPILCLPQHRPPMVAYCVGGDLNVTALERTWVGSLLRLAYRRASLVLYSNINMRAAVAALGLSHARYMPLPVDTERFRPPSPQEAMFARTQLVSGADFVCFSPTRHDWNVKGNDLLIHAWARAIRSSSVRGTAPLLVLCEWGTDAGRSKRLVNGLGLTSHVRWITLLDKGQLRHWYWAADVVIDQFKMGAFGMATLEAMSCGRPVVCHVDRELATSFYPTPPPTIGGPTPEDIAAALELLRDPRRAASVGEQGRRWVELYHGPGAIFREHMAAYESVL